VREVLAVTTRQRRRAAANDEAKLRPTTFDAIVGNAEAIEPLRVACGAAKRRGDMPGHVLLIGPPGTGKTTIAGAMAHELHALLTVLYGPNMRSDTALTSVLVRLSGRATGKVLMIDEIHRMYGPVQEKMYTLMEDGAYRYSDGSALAVERLTVVGATTDPERLLSPMLDRFTYIVKLRLYDVAELATIAERAARTLGYAIDGDAAVAVAQASKGTPRVAIKLVRALRDYATMQRGGGPASVDTVRDLLAQPALLWQMVGRNASGQREDEQEAGRGTQRDR
jgi:Holliday junction DNA helicase RuvB